MRTAQQPVSCPSTAAVKVSKLVTAAVTNADALSAASLIQGLLLLCKCAGILHVVSCLKHSPLCSIKNKQGHIK